LSDAQWVPAIEAAGLCDCRWLLALVCRWVSGVYEAGLWDSPSESGVARAFLPLGVPALYPVGLSVSVPWQWRRRPAVLLGGPWGLCSWRRRRRLST
jgi:hypothetical protein